MTNNDKSQPTGWVVVDFSGYSIIDVHGWKPAWRVNRPFSWREDAQAVLDMWSEQSENEVHPWPLPASVIARLKERHPTVDWSQVPVADEPAVSEPSEVERLRAEIQLLNTDRSIRDSEADGKRITDLIRVQAVKDAEVDRLKRERDEARAEVGRVQFSLRLLDQITSGGAAPNGNEPEDVQQICERFVVLTRERDEARAELARAIQEQNARTAEYGKLLDRERSALCAAQEQLAKSRLSRLDEFAKAALTWALSEASANCKHDDDHRRVAEIAAVIAADVAQATIRAIDGAGGA